MKALLFAGTAACFVTGPVYAATTELYPKGPATIECVVVAAQRQGVPANILLALASVEGGKNGQMVGNANGTRDLGHFQINEVQWSKKGRFANYPEITKKDVAWRGCYNAELAAWILRGHIDERNGQDYWTRVANYHSRTPEFNRRYRKKVIPMAIKWGQYLQQRYTNVSIAHQ